MHGQGLEQGEMHAGHPPIQYVIATQTALFLFLKKVYLFESSTDREDGRDIG